MTDEPETLEVSRCWDHLRSARVGRVAAVVDDALVIRPVNFAVDHGTLLMRTAHGSLIAQMAGLAVAFEADGTEHAEDGGDVRAAWSVVLNGTMRTVAGGSELVDTLGVPLFPWHASPKPVFVRLDPDTLSGRRFEVADPEVWRTVLGAARRSAHE